VRDELARAIADRHQLHRELRNARGDTDEVNLRGGEDDDGAEANRFRAAQVENEELRRKVQELQQRQRAATAAEPFDDLAPRPAAAEPADPAEAARPLPESVTENLNILEESIDSLRANMRAASDETAVMEETESVAVVSNAVSQAAEHVERASAALRALIAYVEG
jgi:hypothetical protein